MAAFEGRRCDVAMSCLSCEADFTGNLNAFIDHMTETHAEDSIQCTHCGEQSSSGAEYAMHFIYSHTVDEKKSQASSPATEGPENLCAPPTSESGETFACPQCAYVTTDPAALTTHFEMTHSESSDDSAATSSKAAQCPVCLEKIASPNLDVHVESHFDQNVVSPPNVHEGIDYQLALELDRQEREAIKQAEKQEFELLRREYGMDETGSYNQQGLQALDRAYGKGQMTLGQLYDAKQRLSLNETAGVEGPNYPTKNLIDKIGELSRRCADVLDVHLCTTIDHYSSSSADFGFGCGYRNIQMLLSSLKHSELYRKALWGNGPVHVPSIPKIQALIESAWEKGFDPRGCAQLNGRLRNTRKWIGATEAAVLLLSYRVRVQLIDVHAPTGPKATHPQMLRWCYDYFKEGTRGAFVPPVYFQHEGHSRTVIGVERTRSGQFRLLIFDPSHSRQRMQQLANSFSMSDLKLIRKAANDLTKPKYQLVAIRGLIENDEQLEWFKSNFDHVTIPTPGNGR